MMSQYLVREPATSVWMLARAPLGDGYAALHAGLFAMQDANHLSVDTLMSFPRRSEPKVYFWKKMGFPTFVPKVAPAYVCAVVGMQGLSQGDTSPYRATQDEVPMRWCGSSPPEAIPPRQKTKVFEDAGARR